VTNWVRGFALAVVFAVVGAFAASLWLEIRREAIGSVEDLPGYWEGRRIRVEVLNGAGVDGLAAEAKDQLRDLMFDVVYWGNLEDFDRDTSVAIARLESIEPARRVADALGLRHVQLQPDKNLYLDVTVILGADWIDGYDGTGEQEVGFFGTWWARIKRAAQRLWPG
jgi:hypothetical protein